MPWTLDEVVPMKTKMKPKYNKKPWYDTDLHGQRRILKNRERNGSRTGKLNCGLYTNEEETDTTQ